MRRDVRVSETVSETVKRCRKRRGHTVANENVLVDAFGYGLRCLVLAS